MSINVKTSYSFNGSIITEEALVKDANKKGYKYIVIDDLIATGGTLLAAKNLIEQGGGEVTDFFGVIGLPALNYKSVLAPCNVTTLINYDGE